MKSLLTKSRWIWLSETSELNQYVDFRRSFSLPFKHGRVLLYISADSRYSAFINGQYIPASQYADYTNYKVYDTLDITEQVHEGQNVLAIVGYFQGEDSSIYRLGQAGLWFTVVAECGHSIYSDAQTYCRLSREYVHNRIFEISCRTLLLCMHEHYEDCPWREQALYAMDSRSQMLYGYYAFGEVEFAQASLRLLALGQRSDGLLELCAPAKVDVTIPIFSLNFIQAVCENVTFSGDVAFGREMLAVMERILITFFNRMDSCGLVPAFSEIPYWNFYDWAERLDGGTIFKTEESPHSYDSPLNALLSIILAQMAELYTCLGDTEKSSACIKAHESLNSALEAFWDEQRGVYATYLTDNGLEHYCELSQALIICAGAVPIQRKERILTMLTGSHGILIPTTPGMKIFKYDALMQCPEKYAEWVKEDIGVTWGNMLFSGATSFWETAKGAWDFESAGSLCHGWSSVPIYFYCRYVLGEQLNGQREKPIFCGLYDCKRVIKY